MGNLLDLSNLLARIEQYIRLRSNRLIPGAEPISGISTTLQQDFGELSRVAAGNALAVQFKSVPLNLTEESG